MIYLVFLFVCLVIISIFVPVLKLVHYCSKPENTYYLLMERVIEENHDPICRTCEDVFFGHSCNTWYFQCEGCCCDRAYEYFFEELETADLKKLLIM